MGKRKRERGDVEGAKYKKAKEHSEDGPKPSEPLDPAINSPKLLRDGSSAPKTDPSSETLKRQEVKRETQPRKSEEDRLPLTEDQESPQPGELTVRALENVSPALRSELPSKVLKRRAERHRKKAKRQADGAELDAQGSLQSDGIVIEAIEGTEAATSDEELSTKKAQTQEAKRERSKDQEDVGSPIANGLDGSQLVNGVANGLQSAQPVRNQNPSAIRSSRTESRRKRKRRNQEKVENAEKPGQASLHSKKRVVTNLETTSAINVNASTKALTRRDSRKRKQEQILQKPPSWKVSEPCGGQMLDLDPLFSLNEESVNFL